MPTLNQVRTRIDSFVSEKWPTIVARQENFRTNRGRYWQGLLTHSQIPEHTSSTWGEALADKLSENPSDQFENWSAVFPEWVAELLPCAVQCDTYDGPQGQGWTLTVWGFHNGDLWTRTVNVGPETSRARPWARVQPDAG
jgi:hypothetical protein